MPPLMSPASDPSQARARRRSPGHRAPELELVPAACAAQQAVSGGAQGLRSEWGTRTRAG